MSHRFRHPTEDGLISHLKQKYLFCQIKNSKNHNNKTLPVSPIKLPTISDSTFHTTHEDLRKAESKVSQNNDGNVPSESEPSQMKVRTKSSYRPTL